MQKPNQEPTVTISVCAEGPFLVRGNFELQDITNGERIDPHRPVVALCRCGRSRIKPFCDGSHVTPKRRDA